MNHAAHLAIIKQMIRHKSCDPAGDYKAEIDVFLEFSCLFDNPVDVGNLISGSSAFSKTSLNIRKFTVQYC